MNNFSMNDIFPLIEEGIARKGKYRFYPNGISMLPLLRQGIDSVELCAVKDVNKYDMVMYQRDDGSYVLHRVVEVRDELYDFCGDNQSYIERGIRRDQIKAYVSGYYKGDKYIPVTDRKYLRYAKRRVASIPWRHSIAVAKSILNRVKE